MEMKELKAAADKVAQAKEEYEQVFGMPITGSTSTAPYTAFIGKAVFIRTVTMFQCGRLVEVHPQELVLEDASWVAWPPEMFSDMLKNGPSKDVEPFPGRVVVGRGAVVDVCECLFELPRKPKR